MFKIKTKELEYYSNDLKLEGKSWILKDAFLKKKNIRKTLIGDIYTFYSKKVEDLETIIPIEQEVSVLYLEVFEEDWVNRTEEESELELNNLELEAYRIVLQKKAAESSKKDLHLP